MDDDHRQAFIHESREQITELNNSLLALESDPDDAEAMDAIFRTAHTLKGNAAAMGYDDASSLAHAMEDLLDEVRADEIEITPELMDLLFDGVDRLDAMLSEIGENGETTLSPGEPAERIRAVIEEGDGEADDAGGDAERDDEATPDEDASDDDAERASDLLADVAVSPTALAPLGSVASSSGKQVIHAGVRIGESSMKGVDGMFVLETVEESFEAFDVFPDRDAVESGEYDDGFDLFVVAGGPGDAEFALESVTQVDAVTATDVTEVVEETADGTVAEDAAESQAASDTSADADAEPSGEADEGAGEPAVGVEDIDASKLLDAGIDLDDGGAAGADASDNGTNRDDETEFDWSEPEADEPGENDPEEVGDVAGDDPEDADGASTDEDAGEDASGDADAGSAASSSTDGAASGSADTISSVRVDIDRLDVLYSLVEQLVTSRIKLRREMEDAGLGKSDNLDELDKITSNLQNTVMDMRLIPLRKVVDTFPRLVRDTARELDKEIDFEVEGEDVELDRTILTEIRDPLMHILRNAIDHGVEPPEEREAVGKPRAGTVRLTATRERDHVTIEVADDGAGLDVDAIREKAVENGVRNQQELDAMDDSEVYDLVFHPGFSTSEEVTDVSGRGVGMDVVHSTVKQLDGTVTVDSDPGEGTTVRIRLPVTVAIVKVMFVEVGETEYGIPVKNIDEISRVADVETVNGKEIVEHDDDIYPVIRLGEVLDEPGSDSNGTGRLVRIRKEKRQVVLHCDEVLDQEEVVVKPLEGVLSGLPGLSGTAVLGDGDVVSILDVVTL